MRCGSLQAPFGGAAVGCAPASGSQPQGGSGVGQPNRRSPAWLHSAGWRVPVTAGKQFAAVAAEPRRGSHCRAVPRPPIMGSAGFDATHLRTGRALAAGSSERWRGGALRLQGCRVGVLEAAGWEFLVSQGPLGRTTSYTEVNTVLARRTGILRFRHAQAPAAAPPVSGREAELLGPACQGRLCIPVVARARALFLPASSPPVPAGAARFWPFAGVKP